MKSKMMMITWWLIYTFVLLFSCQDEQAVTEKPVEKDPDFFFGADLSYVNQVIDHGGIYKDEGEVRSPYRILKDNGANLVRLRLWHNPAWTKEVYGDAGTQLYNDLADVEKSIRLSKEQGMDVLLDFHYSDSWADPGKQEIPAAWLAITDVDVLMDSVYNYTYSTLSYLKEKGLMPAFVQVGNETNCGFLYTNAPDGFPACNVCNSNWINFGKVVNSAIRAIRDVSASAEVKTRIMLHVADPKHVTWWFDEVTAPGKGNVQDFDIIGFSYYPLWHRTIGVDHISSTIATFKAKYKKDVMILETAYPWTTEAKDNYNNHFGNEAPLAGYPYTIQGQHNLLVKLTNEVKEGGGTGIIYWEPAWISSQMKDRWGTGSAWENNTFFDFDGNVHQGVEFMQFNYGK